MKVVCIGGSPSTGSTLLADLLDSVPGIVCGPELNIFCIPEAYDYGEQFIESAIVKKRFELNNPYAPFSRFFNRKYLEQTGLQEQTLSELVESSHNFEDFVQRFATHYSNFRNKDLKVFAEKTPINVGCIEQFCRSFPDGLFIHIVRDGRSVVASLIARGYSLYEAAYIWMNQTAQGIKARSYSNAIEVKYEELIEDPFGEIKRIVERLGIYVSEEVIREQFSSNNYRRSLPRVPSWKINQYDGEVRRGRTYKEEFTKEEITFLESLDMVDTGSLMSFHSKNDRLNMITSFSDLLKAYGYRVKSFGKVSLRKYEEVFNEYMECSSNTNIQKGKVLILKRRKCYVGYEDNQTTRFNILRVVQRLFPLYTPGYRKIIIQRQVVESARKCMEEIIDGE